MTLKALDRRLADIRLVYVLAVILLVLGVSAAAKRSNPAPQLMFLVHRYLPLAPLALLPCFFRTSSPR